MMQYSTGTLSTVVRLDDIEANQSHWHGTACPVMACHQQQQQQQWQRSAQLVSAFILSRLDYCNSVLTGLPRCTTEPLQRVLDAAARLVLNLRPRDHVTRALQQLHWLPIDYRITKYKLCLIKHLVHTKRAPQYLSDSVQTVARSSSRPGLRSSNTAVYAKLRCRTKFGERGFSHPGPTAWNSLPHHLHQISDTGLFKCRLKTELFRRIYFASC